MVVVGKAGVNSVDGGGSSMPESSEERQLPAEGFGKLLVFWAQLMS